jgi:hypothetical protein
MQGDQKGMMMAVAREMRERVAVAALKEVIMTSTRSSPAAVVMVAVWQQRPTRAHDTGSIRPQG